METINYQKQAVDFLAKTNTSFIVKFWRYDFYFDDDKERRDIYKITLVNNRRKYTFKFGQSIANMDKKPTKYDVLACLTKYDPGTFENFCSDYGYDTDSRKAEKIYKAVVKEWQNLNRIFTKEELELLAEIQ